MIFQLNVAPGMTFHASAASLGISDETASQMKQNQLTGFAFQFVWSNIQDASHRLLELEPMGSC